MSILHYTNHLSGLKRLSGSVVAGLLSSLFLYLFADETMCIMGGWLVATIVFLGLIWTTILTAHPRNLSALFKAQDLSRRLSFLVVILAAFASLGAIVVLFMSETEQKNASHSLHIALAGLVVVCSWLLVHNVFTLHYAHLYYGKQAGATDNQAFVRGLDFPDDDAPDYLDFAYFSFIIGMTSQVSDVAVKSKRMRRLALLHGVLAFFFNTSIIAVSINLLLSVLQPSATHH